MAINETATAITATATAINATDMVITAAAAATVINLLHLRVWSNMASKMVPRNQQNKIGI